MTKVPAIKRPLKLIVEHLKTVGFAFIGPVGMCRTWHDDIDSISVRAAKRGSTKFHNTITFEVGAERGYRGVYTTYWERTISVDCDNWKDRIHWAIAEVKQKSGEYGRQKSLRKKQASKVRDGKRAFANSLCVLMGRAAHPDQVVTSSTGAPIGYKTNVTVHGTPEEVASRIKILTEIK